MYFEHAVWGGLKSSNIFLYVESTNPKGNWSWLQQRSITDLLRWPVCGLQCDTRLPGEWADRWRLQCCRTWARGWRILGGAKTWGGRGPRIQGTPFGPGQPCWPAGCTAREGTCWLICCLARFLCWSPAGLVTNSILFCWLFKIRDCCKQVRFQQTHNQGLRQLLMTVSWDLRA